MRFSIAARSCEQAAKDAVWRTPSASTLARADLMENCIFCKIVRGEIPSTRVLETDDFIAIRDIQPAAPTHVLVIPRKHVESVAHLDDGDAALAGALLIGARDVARQEGLERGYRVVINT